MKERNKGHVPLVVGKGKEKDMERIWVSIKGIHHPKIVDLLEQSAKEYGYKQQGVLRIRCDVDNFKAIIQSDEINLELVDEFFSLSNFNFFLRNFIL
ncbi:unnamed protein product [Lathyrus sativus]|nr:unnamed protein product [Lathyrus sativus]